MRLLSSLVTPPTAKAQFCAAVLGTIMGEISQVQNGSAPSDQGTDLAKGWAGGRNVVVPTLKGSWQVPACTVLDLVAREDGHVRARGTPVNWRGRN